MEAAIVEACKGSGGRWKVASGRYCPTCLQSAESIAEETGRTATGGRIPRHAEGLVR